MNKLTAIFFLIIPSIAYGGVWKAIVGDEYRNNASSVCDSEGISAAGLLTKNKKLVNARYELCIAQHTNKRIEQEIIDKEKVNQELIMIEREIDKLHKLRKKMLNSNERLLWPQSD